MTFVVATFNRDKMAELAALIARPEIRLRGLQEFPGVEAPREDGETLAANALIKARAARVATGLPSIADDTGLEVAALGGAPGVHTARFAGPDAKYADNVRKLLAELDGVADRRARFITVALALFPDGREVMATGVVDGTIATEPRGLGGFGYDPVFVADEGDGRTFAEMGPEKHDISHRGRAFRELAEKLTTL